MKLLVLALLIAAVAWVFWRIYCVIWAATARLRERQSPLETKLARGLDRAGLGTLNDFARAEREFMDRHAAKSNERARKRGDLREEKLRRKRARV